MIQLKDLAVLRFTLGFAVTQRKACTVLHGLLSDSFGIQVCLFFVFFFSEISCCILDGFKSQCFAVCRSKGYKDINSCSVLNGLPLQP